MSGLKIKHLWRCAFNFKRDHILRYRYAYSEKQAWLLMCREIARIHGVPVNYVMNHFDGSQNNYSIQIEMEFQTT